MLFTKHTAIILYAMFTVFVVNLNAQQKIKIKKHDNSFYFHQAGIKNDTVIKFKTDLFYVKLPDSLKHSLIIYVENAQLISTKNDSLFQLIPIRGMKYSLSQPDSSFVTLLEGACTASKNINIQVYNKQTDKIILQNKFITK